MPVMSGGFCALRSDGFSLRGEREAEQFEGPELQLSGFGQAREALPLRAYAQLVAAQRVEFGELGISTFSRCRSAGRRLLLIGSNRTDSGREHDRVRDLEEALVGMQCDVGEAGAQHNGVEDATECARADTDVIADHERLSEKEDDRRKDVAEALLSGDPKDDTGKTRADQEMLDRDTEYAELGADDDHIAHARRDQSYGCSSRRQGTRRDEMAKTCGQATRRDDAKDDQNCRRGPDNNPRAQQRPVDASVCATADQGRDGNDTGQKGDSPVMLAGMRNDLDGSLATLQMSTSPLAEGSSNGAYVMRRGLPHTAGSATRHWPPHSCQLS